MRPELELFDKSGEKLIPTKHCYAIEWLKAIIENYTETEYMKIFIYLQYMTCPYPDKNPFFNVPYDKREEAVTQSIGFDLSLDDDLIINARTQLETIYDDTTARAYKSMRVAVENVSTFMENPLIAGRDGNAATIMRMIEKYPKLRESFERVENAYLESLKSTKVRGDQDLAYDQIGGR